MPFRVVRTRDKPWQLSHVMASSRVEISPAEMWTMIASVRLFLSLTTSFGRAFVARLTARFRTGSCGEAYPWFSFVSSCQASFRFRSAGS